MHTIYIDSPLTNDDERRKRVFDGRLFIYTPCASSRELCAFAHTLIQEAFGKLDPITAQFHLSTEDYINILARLKPKFVHHPESMKLVARMLQELGCNLDKTYIDVPRLKSIPHGQEHHSGLTLAIHAHRDTWYSAPMCQLNWWIPIYDIESEAALAFHPEYWAQPVRNGSGRFNHYQWNKYARKSAATDVEQYVQGQPCPEETIELDPQIRPITRAGGILLFSGAQLHSAVPNMSGRTRFSIDFRTVNIDDVISNSGAPNIDSASTGTTLRDFRRGTDLAQIPEDIVARYDRDPVSDGELVFQPPMLERI